MLKRNELFSQTPVDVIIQGSVSSRTQLIDIELDGLVFRRLVPAHDLDDSLHVLMVQSPKFKVSNLNNPEIANIERNRGGKWAYLILLPRARFSSLLSCWHSLAFPKRRQVRPIFLPNGSKLVKTGIVVPIQRSQGK
jgi:hypothetical protein